MPCQRPSIFTPAGGGAPVFKKRASEFTTEPLGIFHDTMNFITSPLFFHWGRLRAQARNSIRWHNSLETWDINPRPPQCAGPIDRLKASSGQTDEFQEIWNQREVGCRLTRNRDTRIKDPICSEPSALARETMTRNRWTKICLCIALAAAALGLAPAARASDDTARFYGAWITNYAYNGQMMVVQSIHDGSGYRNYVRLAFSVTPAGNGSFSAANGRWSAAAAAPDNAGTYTFIDDNTAVCTNAVGQSVIWRRNDGPMPAGITPPNYQQLMAAYQQAAGAGAAWAMTDLGLLYGAGLGAAQSYPQAMAWFQKAAAAGDGAAMNSIGFLYQNGAGVPKDLAQAMAWF